MVRLPVPGTDRSIRFHAEAAVGAALAERGHPVARWQVVEVDGTVCAVGPRLAGTPVAEPWAPSFAARLGRLLAELHSLPPSGSGPLEDRVDVFRGQVPSPRDGVALRWCWARCWPFDGSPLEAHPLSAARPDVARRLGRLTGEFLDAASGPRQSVVHSDLHREHLLADADGNLTGVLDFGDAFVGAPAWDFALLRWYYGPQAARQVATHHNDPPDDRQVHLLAVAVGAYKLAKTPNSATVHNRLDHVLAGP